jgi:SAM-dependent methyltransferase
MNPPEAPFECGICGGTTGEFLFSARDFNFHTTDESFSVVRCGACGIAQTVPRPPEHTLGRFYPPSYYPAGGYNQAYYRRRIQPSQRDKLDIVRRFRSSGTLLDVGCGAGFFLREASNAGFSAQGVEFSHEAVEFGMRWGSVRITEGDLLDTRFPDSSFDIVTLWHALEHLPRPIEALKRIRALLKPGGVLVIAVPNFDSLQARAFRSRWYHLEVPRHLYHFTPGTLRKLLDSGGFDVLAEYQRSPEHNWAGILGSLIPLAASNGSYAGRIARLVAGRPLARAAAAVETAFHRGGTFTLISASRQ